jgi:hypothetical protein
MAKYRKKPVEIEAITFNEFIEYGKSQVKELTNGMPWSFEYNGHPVTHENDECYLIPTKTGTTNFTPNDMLIIRTDEIYPCPMDVFNESYDLI